MKRKKGKRLNPIGGLESFIKKYPSLFGLLIPTLISAIALVISIQANNASKRQTELEKIPLIDHELIYGEDKTQLLQVKFSSLKPNIKIEGLQVIMPSDYPYWISMESSNTIWKTYDIGTYLSSLYSSYYCDPSEREDLATIAVETNYPIAVKFKYVVDGEIKNIVALYILNLSVYSVRKCKVESLEFIRYLDDNKDNDIKEQLDFLNNTECMKDEYFADLPTTDSTISTYPKLVPFLKWVKGNEEYIVNQEFSVEYKKDSIEDYEVDVPPMFYDSLKIENYQKTLDSIKVSLSDQPKLIRYQIERIDSFLRANPINYSSMEKSNWLDKETVMHWFALLTNIKIQLYKYVTKR